MEVKQKCPHHNDSENQNSCKRNKIDGVKTKTKHIMRTTRRLVLENPNQESRNKQPMLFEGDR